jgi:uncharacterized protein (TIGR00730 family)
MINTVTVYCSSSSTLPQHYYDAGAALGRAIAENNWKLVYGGNVVGLMKTLADAARSAGGKVIGITPQLFVDKCIHDRECEELVVTQNMRDRKQILEERGDAFIALPGGLGTFEEIFDIITSKQLAYHDKPIVLLNIADYWRPVLELIEQGIAQNFIKPKARDYYFVAPDVPQAIDYLRNYHAKPPQTPAFRDGLPSAVE